MTTLDFRDPSVFMGLDAYGYSDEVMAIVGREWRARGEAFLERWLEHNHNLGRRPWAWWEFSAKEEMPDVATVDPRLQTRRLLELKAIGAEERRRLLAAAARPGASADVMASGAARARLVQKRRLPRAADSPSPTAQVGRRSASETGPPLTPAPPGREASIPLQVRVRVVALILG